MRSREVAKEHVTNNQNTRTSSAPATLPVMDGEAINRALRRIAHEIIERNPELASVVLAGIPSRGVEIARRIADIVQSLGKTPIETGVIDVSMHRDDVGKRADLPRVQASRLPLPLENKTVIIVDDVFFTGRTARAAMDAINSFGRPARIQLAALIDRGHRELPIRADYVGKNLPTAPGERVRLRLENVDGEPDAVWLIKEEKAMTEPAKSEMRWQRKDLLGIRELSAEEITFILDTADAFKEVGTREIKKVPALRGKTLVNFFVEPSTRTRTSFEIAAIRLSADVINISAALLQA